MTTFTDIAPMIAKLLRLLDKPGEVAASAQALRRVLGSANLDLHDLANVVEFSARREAPQVALTTADDDNMREMIRCCCAHPEGYPRKNTAFSPVLCVGAVTCRRNRRNGCVTSTLAS